MNYENLPERWPEMYNRAGIAPCPHQMHWDDMDEQYVCLNDCGYTECEPPESKLQPED